MKIYSDFVGKKLQYCNHADTVQSNTGITPDYNMWIQVFMYMNIKVYY